MSRRLAGLVLVLLLPGTIWLLVDGWSQARLRVALTRFDAAHGARPVPTLLRTTRPAETAATVPAARIDERAGELGIDLAGDGAAAGPPPTDELRSWLWSEAASEAPLQLERWLRAQEALPELAEDLAGAERPLPELARRSALPFVPLAHALTAAALLEPPLVAADRAGEAVDRLAASAAAAGRPGAAAILVAESARLARLTGGAAPLPTTDAMEAWPQAARLRAAEVVEGAFRGDDEGDEPEGAAGRRATDEPHERHVRSQPILVRPFHRAAAAQLLERLARLRAEVDLEDPCVDDLGIDRVALPEVNPLAGAEGPASVLLLDLGKARQARLARSLSEQLRAARSLAADGEAVEDVVAADCDAWRWRREVTTDGAITLEWLGPEDLREAPAWRGPLDVRTSR